MNCEGASSVQVSKLHNGKSLAGPIIEVVGPWKMMKIDEKGLYDLICTCVV